MAISVDNKGSQNIIPETGDLKPASAQKTDDGVVVPKGQTVPNLPPPEHTPARVVQNATDQTGAKPLDLQTQQTAAVKPVVPALVGLEPQTVWRHFSDMTRIPHGSGNEAALRAHIESWAVSHGFKAEVDDVGNLLVRVNPDAEGPVVGLQGHLDMVCVNEDDVQVDFKKDPINVIRAGDDVSAKGTSLGADNGIGVAYAMALAEECKRPLELLFTIDEEDGFTGIDGVQPGWLNSTKMLNLDSEEEGFFTVACAGGRDFIVDMDLARETAPADFKTLHLNIDGLKGGHSGVEIHRDRTNAIKAMGEVLAVVQELGGVLYGVKGGSKRNVIPFSSHANIGLAPDKMPELEARLAELKTRLASAEDPDIEIGMEPADDDRQAMTGDAFGQLLSVVAELPTGVIKSTPSDPEQPYVSNNLAIIAETDDGGVSITSMSRSPSQAELDGVEKTISSVATARGAAARADGGYVGWEADYDSPLLATCLAEFREVYGKDAKVLEIHAGLECGALKSKYPDMDVISFGPDITGAHTTNEIVKVGSTERTFELLKRVVSELHGA